MDIPTTILIAILLLVIIGLWYLFSKMFDLVNFLIEKKDELELVNILKIEKINELEKRKNRFENNIKLASDDIIKRKLTNNK